MSIFYIICGVVVIAIRITDIPGVLGQIFTEAFSFKALGGFAREGLWYGSHALTGAEAMFQLGSFQLGGSGVVRFGDGGEVLASFEQKHVVPEGTRVGLKALGGGWVMEEVTAPRNK